MAEICIIFSDIDKASYTGQPGIGLTIFKILSNNGSKVRIISNAEKKNLSNLALENNFIAEGPGTLWTYVRNLHPLIAYLKKSNIKKLHVHGFLLACFFYPIATLFRISFSISSCESLYIHTKFFRFYIAFVAKKSQLIITTSELIKNQLIGYGVAQEKIVVKYLGLRPEFLAECSCSRGSDKADFLYWGDSSLDRGFDIFVRLAHDMPSKKFKALIRWSYSECDDRLKYFQELSNTVLLFYPYKIDLIEHIRSSKVLILPFRRMSVRPPLSILEGMSQAKCVVTTSMKGNEEFISNGVDGVILEFDSDYTGALNAINQFISDEERLYKISINARKKALWLTSNLALTI